MSNVRDEMEVSRCSPLIATAAEQFIVDNSNSTGNHHHPPQHIEQEINHTMMTR